MCGAAPAKRHMRAGTFDAGESQMTVLPTLATYMPSTLRAPPLLHVDMPCASRPHELYIEVVSVYAYRDYAALRCATRAT